MLVGRFTPNALTLQVLICSSQPTAGKAWQITVELKHGHHRYAFLVDGQLALDPRALGITRNDQNERVALVAVS